MEPEARHNPIARGTCALLIDEPGGQPAGAREEILAALGRRTVPVRSCADRFEAIAHAVLAEESHRTQEDARAIPVLILTAEQAGRYGSSVHDALLRTAPHSTVWVHDPAQSSPLSAFRGASTCGHARAQPVVVADAAQRLRPNPRPERKGGAGSTGGPQLRLSGDGPPAARPHSSVPDGHVPGEAKDPGAAPTPNPPLLSDEELAMLLADDWDKRGSGGAGGGA